jgi:tRNA (guanine-N7-)-methyltransferase
MGGAKLEKFAENLTFPHVLQPTREELSEGFKYKGKWNTEYFKRDAPIVVELGCGKGEYTTGQAVIRPERNYIGVDIKGARIWRGAKTVKEQRLQNVGFVRTHVDWILDVFGPMELSEIWLTFSDPQLSKPRKRLTSPLFIERYKQILKPGSTINLKTDSPELYEYTLEQIEEHGYQLEERSDDVYADLLHRVDEPMASIMNIRTFYEQMWLKEGRTIRYVRFRTD